MRHGRGLAVLFLLLLTVTGGCGSRLDLKRSDTQMNVGVRAAKSELWREALFRFERAVQLEPENAMALNNLAVAYEGIGDFEKAKSAYTEALRLDRSNEQIQKNYSRFVEFNSRNKKREAEAVTIVPKNDSDDSTSPLTAAPPTNLPPDPPAVGQPQPPGVPSTPPSSPNTSPNRGGGR
jgi:tetratricopeptide (TPR) repeat protein